MLLHFCYFFSHKHKRYTFKKCVKTNDTHIFIYKYRQRQNSSVDAILLLFVNRFLFSSYKVTIRKNWKQFFFFFQFSIYESIHQHLYDSMRITLLELVEIHLICLII